MRKTGLSPAEERRRQVLNVVARMFALSDAELGELMGLSRQQVQQRRKGTANQPPTRMREDEVENLSARLDFPKSLFDREPLTAARWLLDNHPDVRLRLVAWGVDKLRSVGDMLASRPTVALVSA